LRTIREILNGLKWSGSSPGGLESCEIEILHRGAPGDRRVIKGEDILDIAPRALIVRDEASPEGGGEAVIPYHRVRAIRRGSEVLWKKGAPEKGMVV